MVAAPQPYATWELRTAPRVRIVPPARDPGGRELTEFTSRDLLQPLFGQDAIPTRPFTASEQTAIILLRSILQEGRWTGTWSDLSFEVNPKLAQRLVDDFADDTVRGLGLLGPEQVLELFGQGVHLGRERLVFLQAQMTNQRAVRARLARKPNHEASVELHFAPAENTMADSIYEQKPRLLEAWKASDQTPRLTEDAFDVLLFDDFLRSRPGRWHNGISRPLRAPIELPEDPIGQLKGWTLEVPDRVGEGLDQLDRMERSAALTALWEVQRRGERGLGDQAKRVEARGTVLYVLRPTPEVRVILRPMTPARVRVVEIVRADTLKMFRER
jgi:hypothetical protein